MEYGTTETIIEWINHYKSNQGNLDLENMKIRYLSTNFLSALHQINSNHQNDSNKFIQTLNLQNNELITLPVELNQIPQLNNILVKDNPLLFSNYNNILSNSWKDIKNYLKDVEERSKQWNKYKIMLLGNHSGVKFLWKKLIPEKKKHIFRVSNKSPISDFIIQKDVQIIKNSYFCDIWNLQASNLGYFPSASLFLTKNSVFLLSVYVADLIGDTAELEIQNLNCWFQCISKLSKNIRDIPVIIVLFEDLRGLSTDTQQVTNFLMQKLQSYKFLASITIISSKFEGIENVKEQIINSSKKLIPKVKGSTSWILLYDLISSQIIKKQQPAKKSSSSSSSTPSTSSPYSNLVITNESDFCIEWNEFLKFSNACLVENPKKALKFLNNCGLILFYDLDVPFIVINPNLLFNFVLSLKICNGFLFEKKISEYFPSLPSSLYQRMISILFSHSIGFPVLLNEKTIISNSREQDQVLLVSLFYFIKKYEKMKK